LVDIDLWASIREAKLDLVQSQLDLEKALLEVAADAGDSWDRWQQAVKEWEQKEAELRLRHEYHARQERLFQQKQSIWVEVLSARVNLLQADANRWTAWYNLQLARLDVLRSTELLLDYVEKAKIADLTVCRQPPPKPKSFWDRWLPW
jgi:outer membrane protein TolC